jgi:hypothetical protein
MRLSVAIVFVSFIVFIGAANATMVYETNYSDFSGNPSTPTLLVDTFDIGTHSVYGHVDFRAGDTYDLFQISLKPETVLKRIIWQSSNVKDQRIDTSPYFATAFISFPNSSQVALNASGFYITMNTPEERTMYSDIDINFFDLSHKIFGSAAGALDYDENTSSWITSRNTASAFDWAITFEVESQQPVPEPSTSFLLLTGSLILAFTRKSLRRRKA